MREHEGLLTLSLGTTGEALDPELLDGFAHDVHARAKLRGEDTKRSSKGLTPPLPRGKGISWAPDWSG